MNTEANKMKKNFSSNFAELQADFYHYMKTVGGLGGRTVTNYLSWMKFLANDYPIDRTLTNEGITKIIAQEEEKRLHREIYKESKDVTNFQSGLRKFLAFIQSNYKRETEKVEISKIYNDVTLTTTEREALVESRIGQGLFREKLIGYWHGCAVSACPLTWMLVASHIKPWRNADNKERLDVYNGLLLLPNYDKLFDRGYITFDDKGKMVCSPFLEEQERETLDLPPNLCLTKIEPTHLPYLHYHQDNCFLSK